MRRKYQMKTLKRNNKITTLLAVLAILVLGITIVYMCSNGKSMASDSSRCSKCGGMMTLSWSTEGHSYTCSECSYSSSEAHTGATHVNGGICIVCSYRYETHTETKTSIPYEDTSHIERTTCSACSYVVLRRNRSLFRRRKP